MGIETDGFGTYLKTLGSSASGGGGVSAHSIQSVTVSPGWFVIGTYRPLQSGNYRLNVHGVVSQSGNSLNVRMMDVTPGAPSEGQPVANSGLSITATKDTFAQSGVIALTATSNYQIQAECVGPTGFAIVTSANPQTA